jgi:hypothetical protein
VEVIRVASSVITRPKSSGREPAMLVEMPNWFIRCWKPSMSARRGRLRRVSGSSVSSAQGSRVSAAFFAPEIGMVPEGACRPRMMILSMAGFSANLPPRKQCHCTPWPGETALTRAKQQHGSRRNMTDASLRKPISKAVFPVAGLGTRFLPATKAIPKEMLPIIDRPLIQYAVDEAREAGIEQLIFVTGRGKTALVEHFDMPFELETTMADRARRWKCWNPPGSSPATSSPCASRCRWDWATRSGARGPWSATNPSRSSCRTN